MAPDDEALIPADADVRATRPRDRHVTLLFLGRVGEDTALRCWGSVPSLPLPAEVSARRWERFGRTALALELTDDEGLLEAAARSCLDAAAGLVEAPPEPFRPHVTMARVPRRGRPPSTGALRGWPRPTRPLRVGPVTLFRSSARPTGDRYEVVAQQG